MAAAHDNLRPSPWVVRWSHLVPAGAAVLDLACGRGRHARHFAARGCRVTAVDRDVEALAALADVPGVATQCADLEGAAWPFARAAFDAVVVTNYLHRPLFPFTADALRAGGVLIYETFMAGNERFGKPSNPAFLLRPGELLEAFSGRLTVAGFEQGTVGQPPRAAVQRICALRDPGATAALPEEARDNAEIG